MSETARLYSTGWLVHSEVLDRLKGIQLMAFDVDGTLTDGKIGFVGTERALFFNTKDGHGIRCIRDAGIEVAFVTANRSTAVENRAKSLKVLYRLLGREDKKAALEELGIPWSQIAYMGDDMNDVACMKAAAVSIAPADAHRAARAIASYVTELPGGNGAAREVCDMILSAKGFGVYMDDTQGAIWRKQP